MKRISILILFLFCSFNLSLAKTMSLKHEFRQIIKPYDATVGVAVCDLQNGKIAGINDQQYFPMQSVYKFHLALAVLHKVDQGELSLDQPIFISKNDLRPDTWSPLQKRYPDGNMSLPLREILAYTIAQSDNNGCDILFRLIGGPDAVEKYLRYIGIRKTDIRTTEEEMHHDWDAQFSNRATPRNAVKALKLFYSGSILEQATYDYLWETLAGTVTGAGRLKGLLPEGTVVAHKTGTSGRGDNGRCTAVNDFGIIVLPDGRAIAITVFITATAEDDATNDLIIAHIAKTVWGHYVNI